MPHLIDPLSSAPNSPFLAASLAALAKRRRAIRYKASRITVEKVLVRAGTEEQEKLEISAAVGAARLHLFVWDDSWVLIDARIPQKASGWAWEFRYQGRMVGDDARGLIDALEESIGAVRIKSSEI